MPNSENKRSFLYKYFGNTEYLLDTLINRHLYHSLPSEFNDPFDCRPMISLAHERSTDEQLWRRLFDYFVQLTVPSKAAAATLSAEMYEAGKWRDKQYLRKIEGLFLNRNGDFRVCCFSKSARNTMMCGWQGQTAKIESSCLGL